MELEDKKKEKEKKLLDTAFELFTKNDIKSTSIQDIVDKAGVAKGTFYLYFKDKYDLRDTLITTKSKALFNDALKALEKTDIKNFDDQIIFIIDHVIDKLTKNKLLLKFIAKDLSWGVYNKSVLKLNDNNLLTMFLNSAKENNVNLKNPEVTLFMIIELVSSTCFNSILYQKPVTIDEYKPYLYETIRNMLK